MVAGGLGVGVGVGVGWWRLSGVSGIKPFPETPDVHNVRISSFPDRIFPVSESALLVSRIRVLTSSRLRGLSDDGILAGGRFFQLLSGKDSACDIFRQCCDAKVRLPQGLSKSQADAGPVHTGCSLHLFGRPFMVAACRQS